MNEEENNALFESAFIKFHQEYCGAVFIRSTVTDYEMLILNCSLDLNEVSSGKSEKKTI